MVDRLERSRPCCRAAAVLLLPERAARLLGSLTFISGMDAAATAATMPAPRRAVVATAAYLLRGGVGSRRRPR